MGSSLEDLSEFSEAAKDEIGHALWLAQTGQRLDSVKTMKGFDGGAVCEIRTTDRTGTFRTVYTTQFLEAIYVLHAIQKKSKSGRATPPREIALIDRRLAAAKEHHEANYE